MKRGFTLLELLITVGVLALMGTFLGPLMADVLVLATRHNEIVVEDYTLTRAIDRLRQDVAATSGLKLTPAVGRQPAQLVLEGTSGPIGWAVSENELTRRTGAGERRTWPLRRGRVNLAAWTRDGQTVGLRVDTHLLSPGPTGKLEGKLAKTRVLFLAPPAGEGER